MTDKVDRLCTKIRLTPRDYSGILRELTQLLESIACQGIIVIHLNNRQFRYCIGLACKHHSDGPVLPKQPLVEKNTSIHLTYSHITALISPQDHEHHDLAEIVLEQTLNTLNTSLERAKINADELPSRGICRRDFNPIKTLDSIKQLNEELCNEIKQLNILTIQDQLGQK